jgi:hypothetical protein
MTSTGCRHTSQAAVLRQVDDRLLDHPADGTIAVGDTYRTFALGPLRRALPTAMVSP